MLAGVLALALVYNGPGVCPQTADTTGCAQAAGAAAQSAGFEVVYVGAGKPDRELFSRARVWIQPGGKASVEQKTMAPELKAAIRDLVKAGGGYVGFCAGGFLALETFGWEEDDGSDYEAAGFGLLPGKALYYDQFPGVTDDDPARMAFTVWGGQKRHLAIHGGFVEVNEGHVRVLADSVEVKTRAFEALYLAHGPEVAAAVVRYHRDAPGGARGLERRLWAQGPGRLGSEPRGRHDPLGRRPALSPSAQTSLGHLPDSEWVFGF